MVLENKVIQEYIAWCFAVDMGLFVAEGKVVGLGVDKQLFVGDKVVDMVKQDTGRIHLYRHLSA